MPEKFKKPYQPQEVEPAIYKKWEESGYFNPDNLPALANGAERTIPFSIVLPPPNVTGTLHVGHAYEDTLQDIVVRYQRMRGKKALWIPGTDSAAIATQARVEKNLQKEEGKTRHDLGRDEMVRRVNEFAKKSENTILSQIRTMGASLDWSRYAYTLDDKRNLAVFTAFKRMYETGLIYKGNRIVNWDPKGQTTISDDEIVYEERTAKLVTFKYSKDFPIAVSTTRLETKVGDTAVAVHPSDARYQEFVGKEYDVIFASVPIHIKIVADEAVDPAFGTGALGVTPAHSMVDSEIADRHHLPHTTVIDKYAKMLVEGPLQGKKVLEARDLVFEWLKEQGLLIKEENIVQNVSTSERTGGIIEPLIMEQWFMAVDREFTIPHSEIPGISSGSDTTLKKIMRAAVESGAVDMPQEGFRKTYFHWIDNLHDWCISRQIWFGHRIPVWYRGSEIYCGVAAPEGDGWEQDTDVLDTWFSSALWTFSTLGWPEKTLDLEFYHPTSFMSPAYEILQLWVSRIILMSGFHLGQVPFKKVMIHGLVRAKDGRKFSKSLNNGVDPLEIISKYGADALRMGLIVGSAIGSDIKFDEDKIKGYKHFANKLWNIARFVLENAASADLEVPYLQKDQERYNQFKEIAVDITRDMEEYRIYMAAEKLYHYIWDIFAADLLEESKVIFKTGTPEDAASRKGLLLSILRDSLKLLHPFMPFITEEIWGSLPDTANLLMVEEWPLI
jgi:valyl-tRNA synthetase